jgi:N-methylhydantoinase A/oxoprolinase/acetone carboxylase beta subunit
MSARSYKIGIDVGGTFTHAVAVDAATLELSGTAVVPTTHAAQEGVARGVVESLAQLMSAERIAPREVRLVAHSTTQATNALLEGDVAHVGIVGLGAGAAAARARRETRLGEVELARGVILRTSARFLDTSRGFDEVAARRALDELATEGACAIVASQAFGVEDRAHEERVVALAAERGLPATAASELSQIWGLRIRTRTAVVNASMLPRMLETADMTERALRAAGITAPLMVLRSDGGIMDVEAMRRRPILTMLSGPAAGVAAALMYERISDGIFVEVGGTSSDICLIRRGRPRLTQGQVGRHRLFVRTLDVRTVGVGGGSMPRVRRGKLAEIGPRSAHIAGLAYDAFEAAEGQLEPRVIAPLPRDPAEYAVLARAGAEGPSVALTTTGAANVLGLAQHYSRGDARAAQHCWSAFGALLGLDARAAAERALDLAADKVAPVVRALLAEAQLAREQIPLVGGGGGAEAVTPWTARRLGLEHRLARNAEVISAIGAALGIVQDCVERSLLEPSESDLEAVRREAEASVVRMGADPASIEVHVEIDRRARVVRATARGTPDLRTRELAGKLPDDDALRAAAARALGVEPGAARRLDGAGWLATYTAERAARLFLVLPIVRTPVCVLDREGIVRLALADAEAVPCAPADVEAQVRRRAGELATYGDGGVLPPDVYLVKATQIADLTGLATAEQMAAMARLEVRAARPADTVVVVAARRG